MVSSGVGMSLIALHSSLATTWGLVITFALSVLLYAGALFISKEGWFALRRPFDPRDEVASAWEDRVRCGVCEKSYVALEMDRDPRHDHQAICASCATGGDFRQAAVAESSSTRGAATVAAATSG